MDQEEVWDAIAGRWNKFRTRTAPSVEEFVSGRKGRILDVGCGSGRNFVKSGGLEWSAVDFSANMVGFAKEKAGKLGMDVDIEKADSTELPFDDGSFDCILCVAVLHCVDSEAKRKKTLREIGRVLRDGGEALIMAWGRNSPKVKGKGRECFIPWKIKNLKERQMRYTYVFELDELVGLCESVGLEVVRAWEEMNVNVVVRKLG